MNSRSILSSALLMALAAGSGAMTMHWWKQHRATTPVANTMTGSGPEHHVLYWYDPMVPDQHFEQPGKSPFMDMQLQPKYAEAAAGSSDASTAVSIDPRLTQNLGMRLATVERSSFSEPLHAVATVMFNARDVAVLQTRTAGFVQKVYGHAPGDVVAAGAPLLDMLVPEWTAAQAEFLILRKGGDNALAQAAQERLRLLGMPDALIRKLEKSAQVQSTVTLTAPVSGVIQSLDLRQGMTVSPGMTVASLNGLATVWLEAAVPEAQAHRLGVGQAASATLGALPGHKFAGKVQAILPALDTGSHTLRLRLEFANAKGLLRPGMYAELQINTRQAPDSLTVPSEAVIRTGRRNLVMLAGDGGRYSPVEVETGPEAGGRTVILKGLQAGQQVVASGQFLLDSEASLSGIRPAALDAAPSPAVPAAATTIAARGVIEDMAAGHITLSHQPIAALDWPAMTMSFAVSKEVALAKFRKGQHVRFTLQKQGDDYVVQSIAADAAATGGH